MHFYLLWHSKIKIKRCFNKYYFHIKTKTVLSKLKKSLILVVRPSLGKPAIDTFLNFRKSITIIDFKKFSQFYKLPVESLMLSSMLFVDFADFVFCDRWDSIFIYMIIFFVCFNIAFFKFRLVFPKSFPKVYHCKVTNRFLLRLSFHWNILSPIGALDSRSWGIISPCWI